MMADNDTKDQAIEAGGGANPKRHVVSRQLEMAKVGTSAIAEIAVTAIRQLHGPYVVWVAAIGISAILVLILGGTLIFKGNPGYGTLLVGGALVLGALAILLPGLRIASTVMEASETQRVRTDRPRAEPRWFRHVPRTALKESELDEVKHLLQDVRRDALDAIRNSLKCKVDDDGLVRANIFVPDVTALSSGRLCELYIPDGFSLGMDGASDQPRREREIRFWPNQGLTGVVFVSQRADAACSDLTTGGRQWDARYRLTDDQKAAIHPDLRWIASLPLKVGDGTEARAVAVLNVDGIGFDLTRLQLSALIGELVGPAGALAGKFRDFGCQRLAVYLEEIPDGQVASHRA